ncbi:DNA mismatch endonuclease Vsr [Rhizobium leguminosarum]|uniref:very short patch repair endonuclease n=1 Tax=Rhizobium leguminosarum TaxID=384 RepID=UPI001C925344|nr:DNA mismatch endonuclease Vsr [Rhizobium leguminosarum]
MMRNIRGTNTAPEIRLRRALHRIGLRFRLHSKELPGKPDIVFPKYRAVVFTHGCFWHRHDGCRFATSPKTRPDFWEKKFASNVERDVKVQETLLREGWRVGVVWECSLRKSEDVNEAALEVANWLNDATAIFEFGSFDNK